MSLRSSHKMILINSIEAPYLLGKVLLYSKDRPSVWMIIIFITREEKHGKNLLLLPMIPGYLDKMNSLYAL